MRTTARDHAAFETFYRDARNRLLLQTWALTGDLSAAEKAVRDAFIIAWHHWRKLRRLPDPAREDWVRPLAWQRARRRHSVPHLHGERGLDADIRETLTALGKLSILQRKALLLSRLAAVDLPALSREIGVPTTRAEVVLQSAEPEFEQLRGAPADAAVFEPMAAYVARWPWPRATIITRAGAARRRSHTLAGMIAGCAALAASGMFVSQAATTTPSLEGLSLHGGAAPAGPPDPLHPDRLLDDGAVTSTLPGTWTTRLTSTSGTTPLPCAPNAAADPHPVASMVRTFTGTAKDDLMAESVTASANVTSARAAYATTLGWVSACTLPRMQLVSTEALDGVGDQATLVGLRDGSDPARSLVFGVARSGTLTTAVAVSLSRPTAPGLRLATKLLARALHPVCGLPGAGQCVGQMSTSDAPPPPAGPHPGLLEVVDLPPAASVNQPWAATTPQPATTNPAASHCDETDFHAAGVSGGLTRTFLVTKDSPGVQFGMSQTVGLLHTSAAATTFVRGIESRLDSCAHRELGSKATRLGKPTSSHGHTISLWRVEVGDKRSTTTYMMALVQRGRAVSQLSFIPMGKARIARSAFTALAERAAARLGALTS